MNHNVNNYVHHRSTRAQTRPIGRNETAALVTTLQRAYSRLAPPDMPITMPDELRAWLRDWAVGHALDRDQVQAFVRTHQAGLVATLDAVRRDLSTAHLLAPEVLLILAAIDEDPDRLRACWPADREIAELLALADDFGRPYVS